MLHARKPREIVLSVFHQTFDKKTDGLVPD